MSQEDKEKVLRKVYYSEDGFGSIYETYKDAKKQLNSITLEDTKKWLENKKEDKLNHIKVLILMLLMNLWKKCRLMLFL